MKVYIAISLCMEFFSLSYNKCKFLTKIKTFQLLNVLKADE